MNWKNLVEKYQRAYPEITSNTGLARVIIKEEPLPVSERTARRHVAKHMQKPRITGYCDNDSVKWDEGKDSATYEYKGTKEITNFEQAIAFSGVDLNVWEVERKTFNSWDVTMKQQVDGKVVPLKSTNYQFKLWFKRKKEEYTKDEFLSELRESLSEVAKSIAKKPIKAKPKNSGNALEVDVFDPHLGKLAWHEETGENYDIKIAKERYLSAIDDLINKSKGYDIEKVIYPLGNDFFHIDHMLGLTTKGTQLDTDVRWQKSWMIGRAVAVKSIEMLREIAPVEVKIIPGNHDFQRMFYLGDLLSVLYENCNNTEIDNAPTIRKFSRWGKCAIMFIHGDKGRYNEYPLVMLRHIMNLGWNTEYHEVHTGHFHKTKKIEHMVADEFKGIIVRVLKSISGTDAWHDHSGFVDNIKGAEGYIYNKDEGLIGNIISNVIK